MAHMPSLAEPHENLLGQVEEVRWNSTDGREIEGLLIKPSDPGVILATIEAIHDWLFRIPEFATGKL
ncbi:MAG: hypothetical protein AB2L14_02675 [Candidatus Xenobiia bacterium LiM19]